MGSGGSEATIVLGGDGGVTEGDGAKGENTLPGGDRRSFLDALQRPLLAVKFWIPPSRPELIDGEMVSFFLMSRWIALQKT